LVGKISEWTIGPWRLQVEGSVRTPAVVVTGVLAKCSAEVLFAKDQHAVGDLGAGGEHEPFRVRVRPWAARWDLAYGDAGVGQHGIEAVGELAGPGFTNLALPWSQMATYLVLAGFVGVIAAGLADPRAADA
jgi:hypothetical protein